MPLLVMPTVPDDLLLGIYFLCGNKATLSCRGDHLQLGSATDTAPGPAGLPARHGAPNERCAAVPTGPAGAAGLPARHGAPNEACTAVPFGPAGTDGLLARHGARNSYSVEAPQEDLDGDGAQKKQGPAAWGRNPSEEPHLSHSPVLPHIEEQAVERNPFRRRHRPDK